MMLRRQVVEVLSNREDKEYTLKLTCGHVVQRRDAGRKKPPVSTYCDACLMVLDRLDRAAGQGPVSVQELKSTQTVLRYLEKEGFVESVQPVSSHAVYWRRMS